MKDSWGAAGSRREFLTRAAQGAGLVLSASAMASFLAGCGTASPVDPIKNVDITIDTTVARFQTLASVGGLVTLKAGDVSGLSGNGVFVIRDSETSVVVLDRTCTHQGCQVGPFASNGIATCPCHGSTFNKSGGVVRGPASSPLRRYSATVSGNLIQFTV